MYKIFVFTPRHKHFDFLNTRCKRTQACVRKYLVFYSTSTNEAVDY